MTRSHQRMYERPLLCGMDEVNIVNDRGDMLHPVTLLIKASTCGR